MQPIAALESARPAAAPDSAAAPSGRRWALRLDVTLPLLAVCGYLAAVALRGAALSGAAFTYADAPGGAYLAAALFGSHVRLPLHSELVPGLVEAVLLHAPSGHLMIQLLGPLLACVAVAIACLAVHRLGGPWWISAATGLAMGPIALWSALFPTAHVYTLVCLAALALAIIAMSRRRLSPRAALLTGALCGSAVLSDQGFVIEGLVPLGLTVLVLCCITRDTTTIRTAALVVAAAAATVAAGAVVLSAAGVHTVFALAPGSSSSNTLGSSAGSVVHTLSAIAAGRWYGDDPAPPLGVITALLGLAIALVAPLGLLHTIRRRRAEPGRVAYLLFWASSDVLILTAFVAMGYGGAPIEGHYLIPCLFSAVATAPLLVGPRSRSLAGATAAAFVIVQLAGLLTLPTATFALNSPPDLPAILTAIKQQGLTRGYAGYWLSFPLTWLSTETVHVYPVQQRQCDAGLRVCPYEYSGDAWYRPAPGPTFLLLTRADPCVAAASASLGTPVTRVAIDATTTLVVYDHDVAASFKPLPLPLC